MWIEIFKTGTWTDSLGRRRTWTKEDLKKIVEKYNPREHEAPVVIGHPKDNAPAYGWVEKLKIQGNVLVAKLKDLVPEFVDMVRKGLFKKRSISLYPDGSLRHVGFLGAMPPAVKGLKDVAFSESEYMEYEFEEKNNIIADVFRRLREWIIERFGREEADKVVHAGTIELLKSNENEFAESRVVKNSKGYEHARSLIKSGRVDKESSWSFSTEDENRLLGDPPDWDRYSRWFLGIVEGGNKEAKGTYKYPFGKDGKVYRSALVAIRQRSGAQAAEDIFSAAGELLQLIERKEEGNMSERTYTEEEIKQEFERREQEFAEKLKSFEKKLKEREEELERLKRESRRKELREFCSALKREGKLTPAEEKMGIVEFMETLADVDAVVEFSEGEEETKKTPLEWFKEYLSNRGRVIEFKEIAGGDLPDTEEEKREKLISEYMEKNGCDYRTALLEVSKKHPELFQ